MSINLYQETDEQAGDSHRGWLSADTAAQRLHISSLDISRSHLAVALGTLLWVSLLELGLAQMDPEGSSNPKWSVIG